MASKVARKGGFQIRFKANRSDPWQGEFFTDEYDADVFKLDVERAGNTWPEGWVQGVGYVSQEELDAGGIEASNCTLFLPYALKRIERLYGARRIGDDQLRKYRGYAQAFPQAVSVATALAEALADDDDLRLDTMETPATAKPLLESLIEHVEDRDVCIEDVDRNVIADWVVYMRVRGVSPKTIRNHHGFLHGVFDQATDEEILTRNPCAKTELEAATPVRKKVALEPYEFFLIKDAMKPDMHDFIETAVGTGLRFGELTALTCGDWDRYRRALTVNKAWKRARKGHKVGSPKTDAGKRTVYLGDLLSDIIDRRVEGRDPSELIFTAPRGGRIRQNVLSVDRWAPAVQAAIKAGLDPDRAPVFHDLRHTHITWLRDQLTDDAIRKLVGHTDKAMTDRYGDVSQATADRARAMIDANLRRTLRAV